MTCIWKIPPSREAIEVPERRGMKCSLRGVLGRAADYCEAAPDREYLAFSLRELNKHIEELRKNPTPEMLGEFLSLWAGNS